ncbi:MAG TPA: SDR family oxidoreductase [Propionibacteriaceae bacterium]|nr:SDR family oxidoreductase [Propionibacteriaceae bacterium]
MTGRLSGRVAVVTGGTRGLGFAIARLYGSEGAKVVVASRTASSVSTAVDALRADGVDATGCPCDVSVRADVEALRQLALDTYGRLDIWVNNAGLGGVFGPTVEVPEEDFVAVVGTNVLGTYHGTVAALETMLPQGSGHILNILGRGDTGPVPFQTAYGASKSWVRAFTLAVAKENERTGVQVHALNPGLVQTDLLARVEALPGTEKQLARLPLISTMWGLPPERAALPALDLVLGSTREHRALRLPQVLGRTVSYLVRRLTHRAPTPPPLDIRLVEGRSARQPRE